MEKKTTIHEMDMKDIKYLVLHRGLMLNELELQFGQIYDSEMFEKVPQHTIIAMIMGGWLYRGTESEVERVKQSKLAGTNIMERAVTDQEKAVQIKEVKKGRKAT